MKYQVYATLATLGLLLSCKSQEEKLLSPKVYFETNEVRLSAEDVASYDYKFSARISRLVDKDINVNYSLGGKELVAQYNKRHGTKYEALPEANIKLQAQKSQIKAGDLYAQAVNLQLTGLDALEEGNNYLVPLSISSADLCTIEDRHMYLVLNKPIVINKVFDFNGRWLSVPMPATAKFKSLTMEALVYADQLNRPLKTVMGREGTLILRFGDLPQPSAKHLQIAGGVQFNAPNGLEAGRWYHLAFVCDESSEKASLYINGEKVADKTHKGEFDLTSFFIGYAYDYDSNRIWHGKMSEVRLWSVARSGNELRNNMFGVDPSSAGLFGYWKLNGSDVYSEGGKWFVRDQSPNKLDATARIGRYSDGNGLSQQPRVLDFKVKID